VVDDVGRSAISRVAARQLFDEHRASEARKAELRAAAEQRAIETDQQFRAQLGRGVPASAFAGMTYGQAVASAELDSQAYRPRASVVKVCWTTAAVVMCYIPSSTMPTTCHRRRRRFARLVSAPVFGGGATRQ
jgi:hypothetical protein